MTRKIRVGLVYGGKSGEHDVSLSTAQAVIRSFDHSRYEIVPFYITKKGEWRRGAQLTGPIDRKELLTFSDQFETAEASHALQPFFRASDVARADGSQPELGIDVAFPLLHGTYGEDGTIQGLFEMANVPYVGGGVLASAVGMDKVMMKKIFAQEGLPQCHFRHFTKRQWLKEQDFHLTEIEVSLGYPCFVKPANLGSSVGVSKARDRKELLEAIAFAFSFDRKIIVEEFVEAREVEVSVLGNDEPIASVPGEIVSSNEFYDYKAKYIDGKSAMIIPAELPEETAQHLREMAIQAFLAIDGSGLSRVDFFIRKNDGKIFINEINTMPGFTPFSMYPLLWQETGKPYQELLDDLIRLALERHEAKQAILYSFDVE